MSRTKMNKKLKDQILDPVTVAIFIIMDKWDLDVTDAYDELNRFRQCVKDGDTDQDIVNFVETIAPDFQDIFKKALR